MVGSRCAYMCGLLLAATACKVARADLTGSLSKGPYLQELSSHGVVVRAETSTPLPLLVELGAADKTTRIEDPGVSTTHSVRIVGLAPKTTYRYAVTGRGVKASGMFTTAPSEDFPAAPFTFLAYGDNRTDAIAHAAVVAAMQGEPSDFLVHTGDFVDDGADPASWQAFFDVESKLLRDRCLFSAVGNHELMDAQGAAYLRYFGSERAQVAHQLDDTFRWGNTRFFFVNGWGLLSRGGIDREWLERVLREADSEPGLVFRFLVMHHGPFSSSLHGSSERFHEAELEPLLIAHHIDLVISGHDHVYERGNDGPLRYVVTGGGGAPLYPLGPRLPQARSAESVHHYVRVIVTPERVSLVARRVDGSIIETSSFSKQSEVVWDGDPAPPPIPLTEPHASPPRPTSRCNCAVVGRGQSEAPALVSLAAACLLLMRRRSWVTVELSNVAKRS